MFSLSLKLAGSETEAPTAITTTKISKGGSDFPTIKVHARDPLSFSLLFSLTLESRSLLHPAVRLRRSSRGPRGEKEEEATRAKGDGEEEKNGEHPHTTSAVVVGEGDP